LTSPFFHLTSTKRKGKPGGVHRLSYRFVNPIENGASKD
jgi:hypothetical protein